MKREMTGCTVLLLKSPEEKVVAIGLSDGRTLIHNIEFDETLMTFRQDTGPVTAVSFRSGNIFLIISVMVFSLFVGKVNTASNEYGCTGL